MLSDLEALWKEDGDPRLGVARALVARDAGALTAALEAALQAREAKIRVLTKTHGTSRELLLTDGALYLEGLAILRLAELAGLRIPGEFRYIPADARVPARTSALPPGSWLDIPQD